MASEAAPDVIAQDPWSPQSPPAITRNQEVAGFDNWEFDPLESKQYLEGLEAKLKKLKDRRVTKEPTAKDMLKCLGQVKESHLKTIIDSSETPYVSVHEPEELLPQDYPALAALQRKINPEKQALTTGELKKLVENDDLGKVTQELSDIPVEPTEDDEKDIDTATQDTATQNTATQDTATQDTTTQDTATQDTATQGTATQDTATQETE